MTDLTAKRMIAISVIECLVQGMIAENKQREQDGLSMAYRGSDFLYESERIAKIGNMTDKEVLKLKL
jgi:hypothetical protein